MTMLRAWSALAGLLILAPWLMLGPAHASQGEESGALQGVVVNRSLQAGSPEGMHLSLYAFRGDSHDARWDTAAGPDGRFQFEGLPTDPQLSFILLGEYGGVAYPHPRIIRLAEADAGPLELLVYEPTSYPGTLRLQRSSLLIAAVEPQRLVVLEMGVLANVGDRIFVGDGLSTVRLPLSAGASNLAVASGFTPEEAQLVDGAMASRAPIGPGLRDFALQYSVPLEGSVVDLSRTLEYPVDVFNVFLPGPSLWASSPQLLPLDDQEIGGQRYRVYGGGNLPAGGVLAIKVSGLPVAQGALSPEQLAGLTLGIGLLALTGGLAAYYLRRTRTKVGARQNGAARDGPLPERVRLVRAIAELDERHAAGDLSEQEYRRERAERKRRLLAASRHTPP